MSGFGSRMTVALLALVMVVPVVPASAGPAVGDPTRLLVTYTAAVDGAAEAAGLSAASVATELIDTSRVQVLEFEHARDAARAAVRLASRADVLAVEPDLPLYPDGTFDRIIELQPASATPGTFTGSTSPLAGAGSSWGVSNEGQVVGGVVGRRGIDVGATDVWSRTTGRDVVVAVIDSGVDIHHPLLRETIWRNPAETVNGRDDDGNGYIDDVHGWDFRNGSPHVFRDEQEDAHGTHVAGIIAGREDAASGYRSVAPGARIMPLKFIGADGEGRTSDAIAAIRYAEANGAHVINASWGGPQGSDALFAALADTRIPIVLSAGNYGLQPGSPPAYPAAYGLPNVIAVAAVGVTGTMPGYSSRGREVIDVAAPGDRILSLYPNGRLAEASGTSQSAPHVAGVLALALQRHPRRDAVVLAEQVRDTVRPLAGVAETRAGGIVRAGGLLDRLGTRVPACPTIDPVPFADVAVGSAHHDPVACLVARRVTRGTTSSTYGASSGLSRAQIATMLANGLRASGQLPPPPAVGRFTDLGGNVHRDNIEQLAQLGIVRGSTSTRYEPGRTVTRAEFAATVARAGEWIAGGKIRAVGPRFDDTQGHRDAVGIDKAAGLRIVTGRREGIFDPDVPVRRDQAASMVGRLLDRLVQQGLLAPS